MRHLRFAIVGVAVLLLSTDGAVRAAEPGATKALTPDAKGFIHIRVGDIWSVDAAKQRRLTDLALYFLRQRRLLECAARFDVLAVSWPAAISSTLVYSP